MNILGIAWMILTGIFSKCLQFLVDVVFGPSGSDRKSNGVLCYHILKDWKLHDFQTNEQALFLLKYSGVKDIAWIEREDVSLYCVDSTHFTFVRANPDVAIYDAELYPFLYVSKHKAAVELMTVQHAVIFDYLRGCGKSERDGSNISYLHNIGRCGSTLVTTMVNKTRQCQVLSEPNALFCLVKMFGKQGPLVRAEESAIYEVIRSTLFLLTPNPNTQYFIKIHSAVMNILPMVHAVLPGVREMFMYRALKPTASSFKNAFGGMLSFSNVEKIFGGLLPQEYAERWRRNRVEDADHLLVFMLLSQIHIYKTEMERRQTGARFRSYSYESLLQDKASFCREFFKDTGIRDGFVDIGLTALERDSQKNSALSKDKLPAVKLEVSEKVLEYGRRVGSEQFGLQFQGDDYQIVNIPCQWDR